MNRWIFSTIVFLFCISQVVLQTNRNLLITSYVFNQPIPVWTNDAVGMEATNTLILQWLFNNNIIVNFDTSIDQYTYPNPSILNNISAVSIEVNSFLNLPNVSHAYTGIYAANDGTSLYSLNMTVHEVNISSIQFHLNNDSSSCKAHLRISDSINPANSDVTRMVDSPNLTFNSSNLSNTLAIEILNSSLNTANNNINTTIDLQYTFTYNNFSNIISENILLNVSSISQPMITVVGTSDNRTVSIRHNANVPCVRNITYCLNTSDMGLECNYSTTLNDFIFKYPSNSSSADLSIVYDAIYAKYSFDINLTQYLIEETTTTQLSTSDETSTWKNLTDHSSSPYSSMSPITTPMPPNNSGPLAGWQIALIIVGSIIALILLLAIIIVCCCLKKKKSRKASDRNQSSKVRSSSNEYIVRRAIPPSEPTNRQQRPRPSTSGILSAPVGRIEQREGHQSSSHDHHIRPTIPQPTTRFNDVPDGQDIWRTRSQTRPLNREEHPQSYDFQPMPASKYQLQVPHDGRRPLDPNDDDDTVLQF